MDRTRPLVALFTAMALAVPGITALSSAARAADADLARNGGFESGLDGWTCTAGTAVTSPVRSGSSALQATPAGSDNARCAQTVTVQPDSQYTLSGYVTFRTGPSTTEVTLYTHGWYGTGASHADDISLVGPSADPGRPPAPPTGLRTGTITSSSVALSWTAATGATSYAVYRDGVKAQTVSGTSATVTGLSPQTAYAFQVAAVNDAGESARSATVTATTTAGGGGSSDLPPHALVGYLHASFANGSGYTPLADVPDSRDVIDLAFGEPTSVTSGDIRFTRRPVAECPNVESDADFKAAIRAKQEAGKKVLISIGGQNGQVQLTTALAQGVDDRKVRARPRVLAARSG